MASRAPSYALPETISPSQTESRKPFFFSPINRPDREPTRNDTSYAKMPKNRPRGESDLGRPLGRARTVSNAYSFSRTVSASELGSVDEKTTPTPLFQQLPLEILSGLCVPLPFLLASLIHPSTIAVDHNLHSPEIEAAEELIDEVAGSTLSLSTKSSGLIQACTLASATLLIIGLIGRLSDPPTSRERRKSGAGSPKEPDLKPTKWLSLSGLQRLATRIASVTLPFLATVEIGGARTGAFLLACIAGGLIAPEGQAGDQLSTKSWKRSLLQQKWTLFIMLLFLGTDLAWLKPGTDLPSTVRGYAALAKSTLFLQLPRSRPNNATIKAVSPLIKSKEATNATLLAGLVLGVATFVLSTIVSAPSAWTVSSFLLSTASILSAAAFMLLTDPSILRGIFKTGLLCGITFCFSLNQLTNVEPFWQSLTLGVLFVLIYVAVQLDTKPFASESGPAAVSKSRTASTQRVQSLSKVSPVTRVLLKQTEDMPLLHSVLSDKESRRILYFMGINLGFMFIQTFYALVAGSLGLLSDSIHMLFDCIGLLAGLAAAIMSKWPPNAQFPYGYGKVETLAGLGNGIFLMFISFEIILESIERFSEGAELHRLDELLVVSVGGLLVNCIGLLFIGHHHHHGHSHGHSHGHEHHHDHANPGSKDMGNVLPKAHGQPHSGVDHQHELKHSHGSGNQHHHSHEHHNHDHHNHKHHNHDQHNHDHHGHDHHGSHANENMAGIYLHILADTMGSVAVIASTILTKYTGWSGWDPIASFIIAVLIMLASWPLVVGSAKQLILAMPNDVEYRLRTALQDLANLSGVSAYAVPRLWVDETEAKQACDHDQDHDHDHDSHLQHQHHDHSHHPHDHHVHGEKDLISSGSSHGTKITGVIHVIAAPNADMDEVRDRVSKFLRERNIEILVHVEREGNSNCWCGGSRSTVTKGGHVRDRSTVAMGGRV